MEERIIPSKFLLIVSLWLSLSNFPFEAYGDASAAPCLNCSNKCEYPCQQPSPPNPEYSSFEAPPPPSGYSIYQAPPPPHEKGQSKCPPAPAPPAAVGVQCCNTSAPYIYAPPNPYSYVPYGEGQSSASTLVPVLVPLVLLFPCSNIFVM